MGNLRQHSGLCGSSRVFVLFLFVYFFSGSCYTPFFLLILLLVAGLECRAVGRSVANWFTLNLAVKRNNNNATDDSETTDPTGVTVCDSINYSRAGNSRSNDHDAGNMIAVRL